MPCPKVLDVNVAPDLAVTLWSTESSFVHLMVWPTFAVTDVGLNWMFFIETATVPPPAGAAAGVLVAGAAAGVLAELLLELELLLPQPATSAPPSARQAATE